MFHGRSWRAEARLCGHRLRNASGRPIPDARNFGASDRTDLQLLAFFEFLECFTAGLGEPKLGFAGIVCGTRPDDQFLTLEISEHQIGRTSSSWRSSSFLNVSRPVLESRSSALRASFAERVRTTNS